LALHDDEVASLSNAFGEPTKPPISNT
jgi:hypothetical protein